ncbi:uncharacterized protein PITG_08319 [Phytophthora infestans T30-4]|uniref:Uncharacterized protein n=1 Tax=Phytophthora infestans (strain T30-4) TaxID=403677 RepID=D0NAB2_PHYIT|nr:uncharacterized protein PITG_08319 [Phytophthora infestans T30-4]EEY54770.1 hypothetical protein PITG_08319 [Phytophthora infestans T30-4]|eukprot:XP_002903715.1 hypothetical protein PITG_08319 [Phytophthora infestans T30-4]
MERDTILAGQRVDVFLEPLEYRGRRLIHLHLERREANHEERSESALSRRIHNVAYDADRGCSMCITPVSAPGVRTTVTRDPVREFQREMEGRHAGTMQRGQREEAETARTRRRAVERLSRLEREMSELRRELEEPPRPERGHSDWWEAKARR